jgi:ATPases with chaperone activity, ATP-binding subunit
MAEAEKVSYLQSRLNELEATLSEIRGEQALVQTEVNASIVAAIVADWTGIPVGQVLKDDVSAVMELPQRLAEKVIGQTYALTCLGGKDSDRARGAGAIRKNRLACSCWLVLLASGKPKPLWRLPASFMAVSRILSPLI